MLVNFNLESRKESRQAVDVLLKWKSHDFSNLGNSLGDSFDFLN